MYYKCVSEITAISSRTMHAVNASKQFRLQWRWCTRCCDRSDDDAPAALAGVMKTMSAAIGQLHVDVESLVRVGLLILLRLGRLSLGFGNSSLRF